MMNNKNQLCTKQDGDLCVCWIQCAQVPEGCCVASCFCVSFHSRSERFNGKSWMGHLHLLCQVVLDACKIMRFFLPGPSEMPLNLRRTWGCQSAPIVSSLEETRIRWQHGPMKRQGSKLQGEKVVTRAGEGREISQDLLASVSFNFAVGCDLADGRPRIKASFWRR